jgi:A/G-specific adenine glycosylase
VEYSPLSDRARAVRSSLLSWYQQHARDLPWRRTADPYAILVSEVMLQQTQVDRVLPKYKEFLARFPTLEALAGAPTAEVIRMWAPLGYNRRAVNLQRAARELVANYGGRVPSEPEDLRRLPGIGAYTAAAVACFAFGRPVPVVDTNVRRVLMRLEGATGCSEADVRRLAASYLPFERASDWSQALMDLSATICRPASPLCLLCPLRSSYSPAAAKERFGGSNRYLRGRIIDALRREELSREQLASALQLQSVEDKARLDGLLANLERDGLLQVDPEAGVIRLPT